MFKRLFKKIFLVICLLFLHTCNVAGTVVVLSGTSSAGKTMIAKELHELTGWEIMGFNHAWFEDYELTRARALGKEFKVADDEHWTFMRECFYKEKNFWPTDVQIREKYYNYADFYNIIHLKALQGANIIVDTIFEYEHAFKTFREIFSDVPTLYCCVYADISTLIEHLNMRLQKGEKRTLFPAIEEMIFLYEPSNSESGNVDTITLEVLRRCHDYIYKDFYLNLTSCGTPKDKAPAMIEHFWDKLVEHFGLVSMGKVNIRPRHKYDCIMNTKFHTPKECADQITKLLR